VIESAGRFLSFMLVFILIFGISFLAVVSKTSKGFFSEPAGEAWCGVFNRLGAFDLTGVIFSRFLNFMMGDSFFLVTDNLGFPRRVESTLLKRFGWAGNVS
jgi:hypothetical protein